MFVSFSTDSLCVQTAPRGSRSRTVLTRHMQSRRKKEREGDGGQMTKDTGTVCNEGLFVEGGGNVSLLS